MEDSSSNVPSIYTYNGVDEVPNDVTHVRVDQAVRVISERAFHSRHRLEVVELPEGLIKIDERAFGNCTSLKRINLPSTVKKIGESAFESCNILDKITLPDGLQKLSYYAFYHCESLKSINIPSNIEVIKDGAFCNCWGLADVSFSEGLQRIEQDAFSRCKSLTSITFPSSLKHIGIGVEAFEGCSRLTEVHMLDTMESIQARAFKNCNFTNFRMPPLIDDVVDVSILGNNTSLVSLELPETVEQLEDKYNGPNEPFTDLSVRNIALPSEGVIDTIAIKYCAMLELALLVDDDNDTITDALQHRFDDLPIHKICYYQSYHDNETTMQHLKREINPWTSKPPGQLNTTGKQQDCLGMTPLHILACSTKPTIDMYQILIEKYPEALIIKDKWGDIPLLYSIWCSASTEVVELLVESYKSLHPYYEFDWGGMLQTMAKRNVPLVMIQKLINTQLKYFPDQYLGTKQVVTELASCNEQGFRSISYAYTSDETFRYLLRISISKRLDSLDIRRWREKLENSIDAVKKKNGRGRDSDTQAVYDRLAAYESIKEGTPVLELALWKAKIDESRNKRARIDGDVSYKEQCRVSCGADIIIRNVLPYLMPK